MEQKQETEREPTTIKDNSHDRKYFIVTPRLVLALCDNPFEYTFWSVVKDIAGEDRECYLAREEIAVLAMMSTGMASKCRDSLIGKRLLGGERRRDPGFSQSVWHLTIPDLWEMNINWAKKYQKLKDKIEFKRIRAEEIKPSPHDGSQKASPGDEPRTPHDEPRSPGDGKNIEEENPLEKIWGVLSSQLMDKMNRSSFNTKVLAATPLSLEDGVLTIAEPDADSVAWAEDRLTLLVERLLVGILNVPNTAVRFVVRDQVTCE